MSNNLLYRMADNCGMTLQVVAGGFIQGSKYVTCDHVLPGMKVYQKVVSSVMTDKLTGVILGVGELHVGLFVGLSTKNLSYMVVTSLDRKEATNLLEGCNVKEWQDAVRVLQSKAVALYVNQQGKWIVPPQG